MWVRGLLAKECSVGVQQYSITYCWSLPFRWTAGEEMASLATVEAGVVLVLAFFWREVGLSQLHRLDSLMWWISSFGGSDCCHGTA